MNNDFLNLYIETEFSVQKDSIETIKENDVDNRKIELYKKLQQKEKKENYQKAINMISEYVELMDENVLHYFDDIYYDPFTDDCIVITLNSAALLFSKSASV